MVSVETIKTQVAVLGAGPAGLAAALRAAQLGLQVDLFEKTGTHGGVHSGGIGPFAAGSHIQKKYGRTDGTVEKAYKYLMDFTHATIDARLASAFIRKTAFTIQWLEDLGVIFADPNTCPFDPPGDNAHFCHTYDPSPEFPGVDRYLPDLLRKRIDEQPKVTLHFNAAGKRLLTNDGAVTGLIVQTADGDEITVEAGAVIIGTGGFMGNPELLKKYTTYENDKTVFFSCQRPNICGDGMQMAWAIGAGHSEMMLDVYKGMPIYCGPMGTKPEWSLLADPNLMVNCRGERFIDETCERYYLANAIHRQPGGYAYMVTASSVTDRFLADGVSFMVPADSDPPYTDVEKIVAEAEALNYPYLFSANSPEELAQKMGVPCDVFLQTLAEYNEACETGSDTIFFKQDNLKKLEGKRWFAAQFYVDSFGALGGLKINDKTEVIRDDLTPIPGLYGAGSEANSIYAGTYPGVLSGNTSGFAYTTGIMAAESAAQFLKA
jgi:fumarate reductase flavoprotein subunit